MCKNFIKVSSILLTVLLIFSTLGACQKTYSDETVNSGSGTKTMIAIKTTAKTTVPQGTVSATNKTTDAAVSETKSVGTAEAYNTEREENEPAQSGNPENVLIGAIRWDAWVGGDAPSAGFQVERSLGPNEYHFRLPFYGTELTSDSVQARETTQATMDADIAFAKSMGLGYWAYVYYENDSGLDQALDLHLSSIRKNDVNFCYVIERSRLTSTNADDMVTRMQLSNYQTVAGGHPLVYLFNNADWTIETLDILRSKMTMANLATPYVVYMGWTASVASSRCTILGCQAISAYCTSGSNGKRYVSLASAERGNWDLWKATGQKVVPFVTTGWDPRPRIDNPVSWTTYDSNNWAQTATATEIADHLSESLAWTKSNQTTVDANTVLIYAWNEFDEGGWICPTLFDGTQRIDAIREMLTGISSNTSFEKETTSWTAQNSDLTINTSSNLLANPGYESGTTSWSGYVSNNFSKKFKTQHSFENLYFIQHSLDYE